MPRIPYASTTQAKVSPPTSSASKVWSKFVLLAPTVWAIFGCPRGALQW
jgi:hypothetical protein